MAFPLLNSDYLLFASPSSPSPQAHKMVKRMKLGGGPSRDERDSACSSHLSHGLSPNQTAIKRNNPRKFLRSVGDGETVEFDVVEGEKVWGPMVGYKVDQAGRMVA